MSKLQRYLAFMQHRNSGNNGTQPVGLVSMGVPPPVPFSELPADVQARATVDGDVAPLDYDG